MIELKFTGRMTDTEISLVIEKVNKRGRPPKSKGELAALIMADAWSSTRFAGDHGNKDARISRAIGKAYSEPANRRNAVRNANKKEFDLFQPDFSPGPLIYGEGGAAWFTDKATEYPGVVVGYAWVWAPSMKEAVFGIAQANNPDEA